ncbi:hypothetical protein CEXT_318271 [Caerostris extrusa]|uniref:Uncharacterized protein n=1 Tax=Caerostris extrusa TaxID=172846 RepID=A0AAV4MZL0_CAEEX|nr:hypothetical protein CEXT_318271 [Caerostris extrusa]
MDGDLKVRIYLLASSTAGVNGEFAIGCYSGLINLRLKYIKLRSVWLCRQPNVWGSTWKKSLPTPSLLPEGSRGRSQMRDENYRTAAIDFHSAANSVGFLAFYRLVGYFYSFLLFCLCATATFPGRHCYNSWIFSFPEK